MSGASYRPSLDVSFVMQRHGPTLHRKQPMFKGFHVQKHGKAIDVPLVVQMLSGCTCGAAPKGFHDPVCTESVEVPQSSVIDRVKIPALVVM